MLHKKKKKKDIWCLNVGNARLKKVNKLFVHTHFSQSNMLKCMVNHQKIHYLIVGSFHRIYSFKNTSVQKKKCTKCIYKASLTLTSKKSNKQCHREKSIETHCNILQRLIKQLCISHNKKTTIVIIDLYIKYYSLFNSH